MKKRIVAVMMAAAMAMSMTACGSKAEEAAPAESAAAARAAAESGNEAYKNTIFLGFDGSTAACEAVLDGRLTLTCAQQPYDMGYLACQAAYEAINGKTIDSVIDSGTEIINPDNAQARLDKVKGYIGG